MQDILDLDDVLKRYGISESTYYRMVREGKAPPAFRMGVLRRFRLKDLERWEEEQAKD